MTKMDPPITDPEWVIVKNLKVTKYNRTASSIKGVISFVRDLPDTVIVRITYSLIFPRIVLFIPFNCFLCHTQNVRNIIDVCLLKNRSKLLRHSEEIWVRTNSILNCITTLFKDVTTLILTLRYKIYEALNRRKFLNKHKVQRLYSTPTDGLIALHTFMYHFRNRDPWI